uniref:Uncharacterized protein n=1 Tax=Pseudomonas aeruginosa TaxID=287 RepID=A0A6H1QBK5_PSEAI|nr:hypothetical protein [Pseudomonas aeruginosa]
MRTGRSLSVLRGQRYNRYAVDLDDYPEMLTADAGGIQN